MNLADCCCEMTRSLLFGRDQDFNVAFFISTGLLILIKKGRLASLDLGACNRGKLRLNILVELNVFPDCKEPSHRRGNNPALRVAACHDFSYFFTSFLCSLHSFSPFVDILVHSVTLEHFGKIFQ